MNRLTRHRLTVIEYQLNCLINKSDLTMNMKSDLNDMIYKIELIQKSHDLSSQLNDISSRA